LKFSIVEMGYKYSLYALKIRRNSYRMFVGKPEGRRPPGRPRRRWVNNIKTDLREMVWDGMDWIDLTQDIDCWRAVLNTEMNFRVP
jgi:hypothetical protein